ncbi:hypothetical protein G5V59_13150 [Nocardioides sp. W3-2-3]|uniref:hypothetical protein n=1 Tax=Nocardioides convexus TaxID=2712224 RepID=UPI002418B4D9|nr:hypothetical protein [Nocardioides convexus]NHA00652.1 hypothetical protein [Nocardioides convexus]
MRRDKPLTAEFLKDALSAGDKPDGTPSAGGSSSAGAPSSSATASDGASDKASDKASDGATDQPSNGATGDGGLSQEGRAAAGLC